MSRKKKGISFKSLEIKEAHSWEENAGKLVATLSIVSRKSDLKMVLPDEIGEKIMMLAKEAIIDGVEQAANDFIFEVTTAIPETFKITQ